MKHENTERLIARFFKLICTHDDISKNTFEVYELAKSYINPNHPAYEKIIKELVDELDI